MFGHVEKGVEQSVSSLWAGVTGDFVQALSVSMGTSAQTFSEAHGQAIPASSKLLLVELEGFGDSKVGAVMDKLESKKASYVAFYTSSQPSNSRGPGQLLVILAQIPPACLVYGKVFTDAAGKYCMLFCLTKPMTLTVDNNTAVATNYTPSFYNSTDSTVNQCNASQQSDNIGSNAIGFNLTTNSKIDNLNFVFVFPVNSGTGNSIAYKYFWTMTVCVRGTYGGNPFYAVLSRAVSTDNPDNELYVPQTNSYACASSQYSIYTPVSADNDPKSLLNITSLWPNCGFSQEIPVGYNRSIYFPDGSNYTFSLNISGIQVQPYIVLYSGTAMPSNSFETPYNCEGYFSIPILMGIFSVVVLLVILYLGNVFMFSIRTLDRFDDPRAPSISVDRLH
eukprot:Em0520g3a